jgi:hypothetical protein
MRILLFVSALAILTAVPPQAGATKNPWVWPQSIAVTFKHGDRVVFTISDGKVVGATVYVAGTALSVPKSVCAKLHDIQFDSVHIIYPVGADTLKPSDWFEVHFRVGPESRRSSGELPEVYFSFRHAEFELAAITIKKGDSWYTTDL